jgi:hypothetical protein
MTDTSTSPTAAQTATPSEITTVEHLHDYLYRALQLEHATIPPYLTALYSLHPQSNPAAAQVLRVVLVEEMLHLTTVANLMNATGGTVDLTKPGFMPRFPTTLPDGEDDFEVGLGCFSPATLDTFLKIERPAQASHDAHRLLPARRQTDTAVARPSAGELKFFSIGEFYAEIERGVDHLHQELGPELFSGDPAHQVDSQYYYSGGGELHPVVDIDSARRGIELIIGQGEGLERTAFDAEHELAHYYRFEQLKLGRYYQPGDQPHKPTGPECEVDWAAVYPTASNPRLEQLVNAPELHETAAAFNEGYADFLALLTRAFTGQPQLLVEAVHGMFELRNRANVLIRNPIPGSSAAELSSADPAPDGPAHAAPTFELDLP